MATNSSSSSDKNDKLDAGRTTARAATAVLTTLSAAAVATTALATPADAAARYAVWDRVASCESSGNWHISTGNGYYGGLQFSASTWGAYGGHHYAGEANGASRLEQIEVARRVLHSQGPNAWPVCGPRAGLSRANGHATGAPLPQHAWRAEHLHKRHHHHHGATQHHKRKHHNRKHQAKHHANHHATYRVKSGDTLSKIAKAHHVNGGWHHLYRLNQHRLHNPNVLHVGQVLLLP